MQSRAGMGGGLRQAEPYAYNHTHRFLDSPWRGNLGNMNWADQTGRLGGMHEDGEHVYLTMLLFVTACGILLRHGAPRSHRCCCQ